MKVGIICEAFSRRMSGGRAAVALAESLTRNGNEVSIFITNPNTPREPEILAKFEATLFEHQETRLTKLIAGSSSLPAQMRISVRRIDRIAHSFASSGLYRQWLTGVCPDIIHFASFHVDKPPYMIEMATRMGIPVILQPWIQSYACAQGFGFRDGGECNRCFSGDFGEARKSGCVSGIEGIFSERLRSRLRKVALADGLFVASCTDMRDKLIAYGAAPDKIALLPLQFDIDSVEAPEPVPDAGYFLFHGALKDYKGVAVIREVLARCPDARIRILPMPGQDHVLSTFGINRGTFPNLEVIPGITWENGLQSQIAGARAVLIPSLWPTTAEYSLFESMAHSRPIIAFDIGMHKDYLIDGENALVTDVGDWPGYAAKVSLLVRDTDLCRRLGAAVRSTLEKHWAREPWDRYLDDAYQQLLGTSTAF